MKREELKYLRTLVAKVEVRIYGLNKKEVEENESQEFHGRDDSHSKERTAAADVQLEAVDVSSRV